MTVPASITVADSHCAITGIAMARYCRAFLAMLSVISGSVVEEFCKGCVEVGCDGGVVSCGVCVVADGVVWWFIHFILDVSHFEFYYRMVLLRFVEFEA